MSGASKVSINKSLSHLAQPIAYKSFAQLALTLGLFFGCAAASLIFWQLHPAISVLLSVPAGFLLVRLFIIQHDCGHQAFFADRRLNSLIGTALSTITLTPYDLWRQAHDRHHATSGHLDRRGMGDVWTLTVEEYAALGFWGRLRYRAYRHPAVLFGLGPAFLYLVRNRLVLKKDRSLRRVQPGVWLTNASLALTLILGCWLFGAAAFLVAWLLPVLVAATIGIWLFFIQHQYEDTYWRREDEWSFQQAAIEGCSYYRLPGWLHWLTGYIGYHHVHHLCARIPNYRLVEAHKILSAQVPQDAISEIGFWESFRCARLALWCERRQRLVPFRDALLALA